MALSLLVDAIDGYVQKSVEEAREAFTKPLTQNKDAIKNILSTLKDLITIIITIITIIVITKEDKNKTIQSRANNDKDMEKEEWLMPCKGA
ncbi:DUF982 domain-containing protein [Bartonella krasnovii]|nr:DUF982 domain-containing protein [Bartonella krasnovii]